MDLATFETELRQRLPADGRPFVCDGSPLECEAFVVGFNPATRHDIWPYWSSDRGLDKDAWYRGYLAERGGTPSRTRRGLQKVEEAARPVRLLETNIHSGPTKSEADLAPGQRTTDAFEFLLETIRPRVVYAHGREARVWLAAHFGIEIGEGGEATGGKGGPTIVFTKHLSRARYADAEAAGRRIRDLFGD